MLNRNSNQQKQLTADGKKVVLGKRYRDVVHGIEGVATSRSQYLAGCDRIGLEYVSGGEIKTVAFDIVHLEEIPNAPEVAQQRRTGGPDRFTPAQR